MIRGLKEFFVISSVDLVWLLSEKVEDQQRLTKIIVAASVLEGRCHCPLTITMLAAGAGLFFGLQKRNFPTKVFCCCCPSFWVSFASKCILSFMVM